MPVITYVVDDYPWGQPNDQQSSQLFDLVARMHPCIVAPALTPQHRQQLFASFVWSFRYLSRLRRTPTLGPKNRIDRWVDAARGFYHEVSADHDITAASLTAAAIAQADIAYAIDQTRFPFDCFIGCGYVGAPSTPAWRGLLDGSRRLLTPSSVAMPRPQHSPVQINMMHGSDAVR